MPEQSLLKTAAVRLTSSDVIAEVIAMLIAVLIALVAARLARAWDARRGASRELGLHARVTEGVVMLTPFLAALIVMLIVRGTLHMMSMRTIVTDTALRLLTLLVFVRVAIYLLRLW